jgi:hypothetical protein
VYTYGRELLLRGVARKVVARPLRVVLGGRMIEVREVCTVDGKIEGLDFFAETVPVGELGMADGQELDVIIGARTYGAVGDSDRSRDRLTYAKNKEV